MSVIRDNLGKKSGSRGMQNWGVFFPRTPEITHRRQWLTQLIGKAEFVSLNNGDRNLSGRPKTYTGVCKN